MADQPTPMPHVANQDFCAYCFTPLGAAEFVIRGRRYCSGEHADADRRAHAEDERLAEFQSDPAGPTAAPEQLDLGDGA